MTTTLVSRQWDNKWANIIVSREVQPKMGHWIRRLKEKSIVLDEMAMRDFHMNIARTWGIKESRLYGECTYQWRMIDKVEPRFHGDSSNPVLDNRDRYSCETYISDP